MKKFTFKGVLDGFRSSVTQPSKVEPELVETLKTELFQVARTARHGFPHQPTAFAYDPIQRLLAIGTKTGALRILGRPGVNVQVRHDPLSESSNVSSASASSGLPGSSNSGTNNLGGIPGGSASSGAVNTNASSGSGTTNAQGTTTTASQAGATHNLASGVGPAVLQIVFLVNEGALITATADDSIHLWNIRQKRPEIVHSLKFQREKITCIHLPFQSKWLYVGSERGNIHVVNIENFVVSGYVINWNKAIELSRKTHPGPVVHLSDCPVDSNKMLIAYESGLCVLWDLKNRSADCRYQGFEPLRSASWISDGKQFMTSHGDGSLITWSARSTGKAQPVSVSYPHAKANRDGRQETCKPIWKVEWKSSQDGDPFVVFSGGLSQDRPGRSSSITVSHGRNTTVLEMEHNVVDFITLCETSWASEIQEPYAVLVLLQNDLVVVDLLTPGFPCFENPYPMDLHESPVTSCYYLADCPVDLIPALYSVGVGGQASRRAGFSEREWPISGGEWGALAPSYAEIVITGHADGSMKFWDTSSLSLQVLYKLKTSKVFEKPRNKSGTGANKEGGIGGILDGNVSPEEELFAVNHIHFCAESRQLAIAGASSHVVFFRFRRQETIVEATALDVPLYFEPSEESNPSPDSEANRRAQAAALLAELEHPMRKEHPGPLRVKSGPQRRLPGFQPELVCLSPWVDGEAPGSITALCLNSAYGLLAYGNEAGLVVIDVIQKTVLLSMATMDLYSSADPYQRLPRSPKRPMESSTSGRLDGDERSKSPTSTGVDQGDANQVKDAEEAMESEDSANPTLADDKENGEQEEQSGTESVESRVGATTTTNKKPPAGWKGFSLKKKLEKADSRLRDMWSGHSQARRGSASIPQTPTSTSTFYGTQLSHHSDSSKPPTPCDENMPTAFPFHVNFRRGSVDVLSDSKRYDHHYSERRRQTSGKDSSGATPLIVSETPLFDPEGNPLRPPRGLKKPKDNSKTAGTAAATADGKSVSLKRWASIDASQVLDLRADADEEDGIAATPPSILDSFVKKFNKVDSAFSRSRSSSTSSLETPGNEAIKSLVFAETIARKTDMSVSPSLWVGTSMGSVLVIVINFPAPGEPRLTQPLMVSPSGTIFRLKGSILALAFLDASSGTLIPSPSEPWRDESKDLRERSRTPTRTPVGAQTPNAGGSDSLNADAQIAVLVSEKQARVLSLPSQTCMYRTSLVTAENAFVVRADVISLKDGVCIASYVSTGHLQVHSLPGLRPLLSVEFLPLIDLSFQTSRQNIVDPMLSIWAQQMFVNEDTDQINRTFCFSNYGHGLYLCSPSEIEKFSISSDFVANLPDMLGELFLACDMPEPPKPSFFTGLFGGGLRSLDREELFGESASGKSSRGIAKVVLGSAPPPNSTEGLNTRATGIAAEVQRTRQQLVERGERLGLLEERTQRMTNEAESFSQAAHALMVKYRDKKWYQL